jgi:hypothetical protein
VRRFRYGRHPVERLLPHGEIVARAESFSDDMGFTRYHRIDTEHPDFVAAWPQLVRDARAIVKAVRRQGIRVRGGDGEGAPLITSERTASSDEGCTDVVFASGVIWFNGDRASDEDCETFGLWPGMNQPRENWFTKTEACPYDVAVSAVLLRAKALAPTAVAIGADVWDEPGVDAWARGVELLQRLGLDAGSP